MQFFTLSKSGWIFLALILSFSAKPSFAQNSPFTTSQIETLLASELTQQHWEGSFEPVLLSWQERYGAAAALPLANLARTHHLSENARYAALLGAARLGSLNGHSSIALATAVAIKPLLSHSEWLTRLATLRALRVLIQPESTEAQWVTPLLSDPALVVRSEAVRAVRDLRPRGAKEHLVTVVRDSKNYLQGRAQVVPLVALEAIRDLHRNSGETTDSRSAVQLSSNLKARSKDTSLMDETFRTLGVLTGKALRAGLSTPQKRAEWERIVSRLK